MVLVEPPHDTVQSSESPKKQRHDLRNLLKRELFWRDHQEWLANRGYMLRPRFRPGWIPSWGSNKKYYDYEDGQWNANSVILDATRISDNSLVMLKHIDRKIHPHEVEIGSYFSSEPLASHPRNHCIPVYDVLDIPNTEDEVILVIPLLRKYDDPRIKSVGEAVEFFRQVFEGLQFMHQCHVAHRDCMNLNIMMDPGPTFPHMYHPASNRLNLNFKGNAKYYTRTAKPSKYFFIDFGLSRKYNPEAGEPMEIPILGGDKSVPEFQGEGEYNASNPFPTDIYYLGNMIREDFLQKTKGVEFMQPLVDDMVQDDPSKRPNIDQVVQRFDETMGSLSWWTLRSRLIELEEKEVPLESFTRSIRHFFRTTIHVFTLRSPLPRPSR